MNKTELTVVLPHTPRALSPNGRTHWAQKAKAAKSARQMAWACTTNRLIGLPFKPATYKLTWYYYRGAAPDADNCLARCKAYLDGACDAFGVNDRTLECVGIERVKSKQHAGKVHITFYSPEARKKTIGSYGDSSVSSTI